MMEVILCFVIVLMYFGVGTLIEGLSEELFSYEEPNVLCIILWPITVLSLVVFGILLLFKELGRTIGGWINRR